MNVHQMTQEQLALILHGLRAVYDDMETARFQLIAKIEMELSRRGLKLEDCSIMYLSTIVYHLTQDQAYIRFLNGWLPYKEDDGSWTVVKVKSDPVQHGQSKWFRPVTVLPRA